MDQAESRAGARCDNLTVMAIDWHEKAVAAPVEPTTVPMEDAPTAGNTPVPTEPDFMNMTDADIERQIDEIKKALKKHQGGK